MVSRPISAWPRPRLGLNLAKMARPKSAEAGPGGLAGRLTSLFKTAIPRDEPFQTAIPRAEPFKTKLYSFIFIRKVYKIRNSLSN